MPEFIGLIESHPHFSLVIDPAHVMTSAGITELIDWLRRSGQSRRRVVLYANPSPEALRGACALASATECTMVVRGVDEERMIPQLLEGAGVKRAVSQLLEAVRPAMSTLPRLALERWERALLNPADESIKRISADLGVSRRAMERWFSNRRLPSPGRLLAQFQRAQGDSVAAAASRHSRSPTTAGRRTRKSMAEAGTSRRHTGDQR